MTTGGTSSPHSTAWRSLPKQERQVLVNSMFTTYPQAEVFFADVDAMLSSEAGPTDLALMGVSGTGKTMLLQRWLNQSPQKASALCLTLSPSSLRNMLLMGLSQLGYSGVASTGRQSLQELIGWFHQAIRASEKRLVVLDDIQFLVDWNAPKALTPAAEILLVFSSMNLPVVLSGLPEEADFLLKAYPQVGRSIRTRHVLAPFHWDAPHPHEGSFLFRNLLDQIDQQLPLDRSNLSEEALASRLFAASDGFLGLLVPLIQQAALIAIEQDASMLTLDLLAKSYDARLAPLMVRQGKPNPFAAG
ncbi:MAG TPA: ATP-binding protein [Ktedonobacteraceae bacterium]